MNSGVENCKIEKIMDLLEDISEDYLDETTEYSPDSTSEKIKKMIESIVDDLYSLDTLTCELDENPIG